MECFAQLGVDSSKVNTPFLLATTGELAFEISEVVLAETPGQRRCYGLWRIIGRCLIDKWLLVSHLPTIK